MAEDRIPDGDTEITGEVRTPDCPDCARRMPATGEDASPLSYCPYCGARLLVEPLSLRGMVANFIDGLVSLEQPLLRTTWHLLIRPGSVARRWVQGQRRSYTNPVKFLVVVGLIVALTFDPLLRLQKSLHPDQQLVYQSGLAHHATQYFAFFCILLLFPLALALSGVGRMLGLGIRWLEWYALGLYAYGIAAAGQMFLNAVTALVPPGTWALPVGLVKGLLPVIWLAWAAYGYADTGRRGRALTCALFTQFALIVLTALTQGLMAR